MIDIIISGIAVVGFFLASIHDIKTREVPDYLSYGLISLGILYQLQRLLIDGVWLEVGVTVLISFGAGIFGYMMYRFKQWGGADTKLIIALGFLLGYARGVPLFILFFTNFLWAGAIYGISATGIMILKNNRLYLKQLKKDYSKNRFSYWIGAGILFGSLIIVGFVGDLLLSGLIALGGVIVIMSAMMKSANVLMIKNVPISRLTEGDWVLDKIEKNKKVFFDPKKDVAVNLEQIQLMKKEGIKNLRILEGVPFVPSFFIALIVTLINPYITLNILSQLVF